MSESDGVSAEDQAIIDTVVDNFMLLAAIPHPSHHEERISDFLLEWAEGEGYEAVQDEVNNIIFDVPATAGMEGLPFTGLQVHMDMVCAYAEGSDFDPLTDSIKVIRDDRAGTLTADGTSLGSDDGVGIAIVMGVVQGKMTHGPLRVIITVNEEDGMTGVTNLDAKWLEDLVYLINVDQETSDSLLVSTAAGNTVKVTGKVNARDVSKDTALGIEIKGLKGGHSGVEIDKGRLNGIIGLSDLLKNIADAGIDYELISFSGGTAGNAIPTGAKCVIAVDAADSEAAEAVILAYSDTLAEQYKGIEDGLNVITNKSDASGKALSAADRENTLAFISGVINGVNSWSKDIEGLVESSSNLGLFSADENGISATIVTRSSSEEMQAYILDTNNKLAEECGFETVTTKTSDAWPYNPDSKLIPLAQKVYKELNGEEVSTDAVHAGLECGTFAIMNHDLDMISIGPDITDAHTVNETLYLKSIPKTWRWLEGILANLE